MFDFCKLFFFCNLVLICFLGVFRVFEEKVEDEDNGG